MDSRPKKALHARSTKKLLVLPFFDIEGIIHVEYLQGTVTSEVYIEALMHMRDQIRVKRLDKWRTHDWILLGDNASPHKSYDTLTFHRQVRGVRGPHPPYSPDLAPCVFFLFPKLKSKLHGRRFNNLQDLCTEVEMQLASLTPEDFQYCFRELKSRWKHCLEADGNYFEGDHL